MTTQDGYLRPIFVGGCDRSGTTLLGARLARFPGIVALPESQFLSETAHLYFVKRSPLEYLADYVSTHMRFAAWREAGCAEPHMHLRVGATYRDFIDALVRNYAHCTGVETPAAFVDHSPTNSMNVRTLKNAFADMKFTHMIRDGRAVAASLMPQDWGPNDILEAALVWGQNVAAGFAACDYLGRDAINLRFENLVAQTPETLNAIASLAGAPSCGTASGESSYRVPAYAGQTHALVIRKPSPARADAWRGSLTPRQIELFEHAAGPLLESLGYPLVYPRGAARKASRIERGMILAKRWARNHLRLNARYENGAAAGAH